MSRFLGFVVINQLFKKSYLQNFEELSSALIKEHQNKNNILEVTVDFVSEIISCSKDKDKKIISGNPDVVKKVYDTWKFSKDIESTNPNWLLIDTQN